MRLTACLRACAGGLALMASACAGAPDVSQHAGAVPCNAELLYAANYLDDLADQRTEQLEVIRFDSEASMNVYMDQTRRLRMEALRLGSTLYDLGDKAGIEPDYTYAKAQGMTLEGANAVIAAADACVAAIPS